MTPKTKLKMKQILLNNPLQPLMFAGVADLELSNVIHLSADIDEHELHIPSQWHKLVELEAKNAKAYLLIENLDTVSLEKQEQFAGLLKDRRAGNYKLPANVQIILPVADKNSVSAKIRSLALVWDVR